VNINIREIAKDGLPDMEVLVGRVAFIFDGCIVSGWPIDPVEGIDTYQRMGWDAATDGVLWEPDSDVGGGRLLADVTHWIEFSEPLWLIRDEK